MTDEKYDFTIETLGPCKIPSPIQLSNVVGDFRANYVKDDSFVRYRVNVFHGGEEDDQTSANLMQKAGPRQYIYFDPNHVKAGICTCGGLCPGLNDVIRAIVRSLYNRYGVRRILGFQYGFKGFFPDQGFEALELTPDNVDEIHKIGGSVLGTSRGGGDRVSDVVDCIVALPDKLFFNTGIPACLWFLSKNRHGNGHRDRHGEVLFIDARNMGEMITRAQRQLTEADIERIAGTYNTWRSRDAHENYEDVAGFCKAATLEEIRDNDFILTPGRYVGLEQTEDPDAEPTEEKIARLTAELLAELDRSHELEARIRAMLEGRS